MLQLTMLAEQQTRVKIDVSVSAKQRIANLLLLVISNCFIGIRHNLVIRQSVIGILFF